MTLGLFAIYFCFLAAALFLNSRIVSGPWLFLFRGFLPNWRFYHAPGPVPRLCVRFCRAGIWGEWRVMKPRAERRLSNLIFNAQVNLHLSEQTLVEHFAADIGECDDGAAVRGLVTYDMVEQLARLKFDAPIGCTQFQFCLALDRPGQPMDFSADTVLLAPEMTV